MKLLHLIYICSFLSLTSCGGGGGSEGGDADSNNNGSTTSSGLPNDITGLIVFNQMSSLANTGPRSVNSTGIFKLRLNEGNILEKRTITTGFRTGYDGYAHPSGKIVFLEPCGNTGKNRFKMFKKDGLVTPALSPCSQTIKLHVPYATATHTSGKLSPDGSKIATYIYYNNTRTDSYEYSVIIYDVASHKEIKRFIDYASPTWHPDGRLLIVPTKKFGIYMTNKDFSEKYRIDRGAINLGIGAPDISPSGKQVIFSMGQQIWIMDIAGTNLRELIVGDSNLSYPTWSPDEKYVAYFRYANTYGADDKLMFYNLPQSKKFTLNTNNIFATENGHYVLSTSPGGPISWVK